MAETKSKSRFLQRFTTLLGAVLVVVAALPTDLWYTLIAVDTSASTGMSDDMSGTVLLMKGWAMIAGWLCLAFGIVLSIVTRRR